MTNRTTEAELRALTDSGLNWAQISERLGIPVMALRTTGTVLGISSGRGRGVRSDVLAGYVVALKSGATLEEIALANGVTRQAVYASLKRANLPTTCRAAIRHAQSA